MKKLIYFMSVALLTLTLTSCEKSNNDDTTSEKEAALKKAVVGQVDGHIVDVYTKLGNACMDLMETCDSMEAAFNAGHTEELLAQQKIAADQWVAARKYWELSESFLYGPVNYYKIDPHIDSWPLDKDKLESLLGRLEKGEEISYEDLTYGTTGFHSLEYMLYDPSNADSSNVKLHKVADYTKANMAYLSLVAHDVAGQTALLEACWLGLDKLTDHQQALLEELEEDKPEFSNPFRYALTLLDRTNYKTYKAAAEEIVQGCIDIADEVGNTKMGSPNSAAKGKEGGDRNYIESPYALNSIKDFQDNITSIKNSYEGVNGAYSISDYVKSKDATLDTEVREAIQNSIDAIGKIPEPFIDHAGDAATDKAVELTGDVLRKKLEEVYDLLSE